MKEFDTYSVIPTEIILDKNLIPQAKVLYGLIQALCNLKKYCWASNAYLAEKLGLSTKHISHCVSLLVDSGYINAKYTKDEDKQTKRKITLNLRFHTPTPRGKKTPTPTGCTNIISKENIISVTEGSDKSSPEPVLPKKKEPTPEYMLALVYFTTRGIMNPVIQQSQMGRVIKSTKVLFKATDNNYDEAKRIIVQAKPYFKEKDWEWTVETVVKYMEGIQSYQEQKNYRIAEGA